MAEKTKFKTVGFSTTEDFPLKGKELKEVLENLWVFPVAITNPDFYTKWFETHARLGALITKLLDWAEQYTEVITDEPIIEEATT